LIQRTRYAGVPVDLHAKDFETSKFFEDGSKSFFRESFAKGIIKPTCYFDLHFDLITLERYF